MMIKIAIHSYGLANYLLENQVPMSHMAKNKKNGKDLVFYFKATDEVRQLMSSYSAK